MVSKLKESNFEVGFYFFDINRFMPSPNFIKTVLIPCHSGVTDIKINLMVDIIKYIFNSYFKSKIS